MPIRLLQLIAWSFCAGLAPAGPFALSGPAEIRADASVSWGTFSTVHGQVIPPSTTFPRSDDGADITLQGGGSFTIHDGSGLSSSGVHLANSAGAFTVSLGGETVQGVAFTIEHLQAVRAIYTVRLLGAGDERLGTLTVTPLSAADNAAFIGLVDPEARIAGFTIESTESTEVAISDLTLQEQDLPDPIESLPISSSELITVSPSETYLHQGVFFSRARASETETATEDNENAHDLLELFPTLRPGDVLHFSRQGFSFTDPTVINHLAAVFSSGQLLLSGSEIQRLPSAIRAGNSIITHTLESGQISISTDISQDFIVPSSTYITVPSGARYLMLSLQKPDGSATAPNLLLSHIRRDPFIDWVNSLGLVGPLADPESDLDGDGLSLIEEFAFTKDPTLADSGRAAPYAFEPLLVDTEPRLRLNFGVRLDGPLRYLPEYSGDLLNWEADEGALETILNTSTQAILTSSDPTGGPARFGRVRVEYIPPPAP